MNQSKPYKKCSATSSAGTHANKSFLTSLALEDQARERSIKYSCLSSDNITRSLPNWANYVIALVYSLGLASCLLALLMPALQSVTVMLLCLNSFVSLVVIPLLLIGRTKNHGTDTYPQESSSSPTKSYNSQKIQTPSQDEWWY